VSSRVRLFAKGLRTNQTDAEWRLWACVRGGRLDGLKFKRQVPLDRYILDFVCLEARLIVELDGEQHAESLRDRLRDEHFRRAGFETMRFWNSDVLEDADDVAYQIELAAKLRLEARY
jgi:very-short-patch-repair endonuclease